MNRIVVFVIILFCALRVNAQINIWEGTNTKAKVELTPYLVEGGSDLSIVVCPGGSYFWHDMETEGTGVAEWLQRNGINAFVLKYRVAGVPAFVTHYRALFRGNRYPDPQNDLRQAIRYIKEHSSEFGIDTNRIGAMGFSAGGHLVMSAAEFFEDDCRPNFVAPIYPVVTLEKDVTHKRSRRALLGDSRKNNIALRNSLSLENHVPDNCVPVFLVNCKDDPVVKYQNSELLDSALSEKRIPHKYIQYETGGHGFGASDHKGTEECRQWREDFLKWIGQIKL